MKSFPFGKTLLMKFTRAFVILSGRSALMIHNFRNGCDSSFRHSEGNLTFSGVNSLTQSLNRAGSSFSIESGNFSNSSISASLRTENQAKLGSQSWRLFSCSVLGRHFNKNYIIFGFQLVLMIFF